jgi:hypothetical protein
MLFYSSLLLYFLFISKLKIFHRIQINVKITSQKEFLSQIILIKKQMRIKI